MKHDISVKMAFYSIFVELLFTTGRRKSAMHFMHHPLMETKPVHLRFRMNAALNFHRLSDAVSGQACVDLHHLPANGSSELIHVYQHIHWEFLRRNFRKTIGLIDSSIRKFSVDSHQSVDLMILEIICHFEEEHLEVVDYKIQSYIKNLSYRKNYCLPAWYGLISRIFQALLRPSSGRNYCATDRLTVELKAIPGSGLLSGRSLQPGLFLNWVKGRRDSVMGEVAASSPAREIAAQSPA